MTRIRKGAFATVFFTAVKILAFLGAPEPARTAAVSADVAGSSTSVPTDENAYCAKGDVWTGGTSDGPAHLPQGCGYTGLDGSPSPGKVISLAAGGDVVSTVKAASCGDTIELQEGALFSLKGDPTFPSKGCDSKHWITIRTSAPDSALPAEHVRINPSYAGVPSLSGRPPFSGPNKNVMAKLLVTGAFIEIGDHYRLIGLEITRPGDGNWYDAVATGFMAIRLLTRRIWCRPKLALITRPSSTRT